MRLILFWLAIAGTLALGGCAGAGAFFGTAAGAYRNETRGPEVVYVSEPRPYYRPYWHHRGW